MMYQNNFVACIKVGGRVLRETQSIVHIPFGSEYSILLKNLNSVRAHANVTVDGQCATVGKLIIPAHGTVELERFLRGNLDQGNRFKFIERTAAIEEHRGVGAEDGLVSVEFWKEIINSYPVFYPPTGRRSSDVFNHPGRRRISGSSGGPIRASGLYTNSTPTSSSTFFNSTVQDFGGGAAAASADSAPANEAGITVEGSISNQGFVIGDYFPVESTSTVVTLHLKGGLANRRVNRPITVDCSRDCRTCGKKNKSDAQYCNRCGTSLVIL